MFYSNKIKKLFLGSMKVIANTNFVQPYRNFDMKILTLWEVYAQPTL